MSGHESELPEFAVDVFLERVGEFVVFRVRIVVRSTIGDDPIKVGDEKARVAVVAVF